VEASNAREFAERAGLHRGSITFDVTPQYRELKSYLDDPSCQPHLGKFMNRSFMQESLFCWIDINDYSLIPTSDYRRHMALQLIHKYIRPGAPMEVGFLEGETIEKYLKIEEKLKLGGEPDTSLFDKGEMEPRAIRNLPSNVSQQTSTNPINTLPSVAVQFPTRALGRW